MKYFGDRVDLLHVGSLGCSRCQVRTAPPSKVTDRFLTGPGAYAPIRMKHNRLLTILAIAGVCAVVLLAPASHGPTRAQEIVQVRPTNVRAESTAGGILLTWDAPVVDSISGYRVFRRWLDMKTLTEPSHTVNTGSTETSYTDAEVEAGVLYAYYVRALLSNGRLSSWSWHANAKALGLSASEGGLNSGAPFRMWNIMEGELPPGLYLDPYEGSFSGVPMVEGNYSITVERRWVSGGNGALSDSAQAR